MEYGLNDYDTHQFCCAPLGLKPSVTPNYGRSKSKYEIQSKTIQIPIVGMEELRKEADKM